MTMTQRFLAYAAAFEDAFRSDDWSTVEPFFTENAVYETPGGPPFGGRHEGRGAIMAYFKQVLDQFDRRFDSRELAILEGPTEKQDATWVRWAVTYRLAGSPDLRIEGEETAFFEGDRICRLEDRIGSDQADKTLAFMAEHGAKLLGSR